MYHLEVINAVLYLRDVPGDTSIMQLRVMQDKTEQSAKRREVFLVLKAQVESITSILIFKGLI